MRPYHRGSDFPTLLALIIAVGFPLLLLSLLFDLFPHQRLNQVLDALRLPWAGVETPPTASPVAAIPSPSPSLVALTTADWSVPDGRFFTQTNGRAPLSSATGFAVVNAGGLAFWDEFQRLGGAPVVGYPLSNRFTWRGFTVQVFQKLVFQGPEAGGEINLLNVMDDLSALGKDQWLRDDKLVPLPLEPEFDAGRDPAEVPAAHLELLSKEPALDQAYRSVRDPFRQYGLPTSQVTEINEYLVAIRCQRTVLQLWKRDMPFARAGDVTAANAGQLAVEAGLFPTGGLKPIVSAPPPLAVASPSPTTSR